MRQLLVILAILFGFSAVAGPAAAAAHLNVPAAVVVFDAGDASICAEVRSELPKLLLRPCAKKLKGGLLAFCHQFQAVLPVPCEDDVRAGRQAALTDEMVLRPRARGPDARFRPPQVAPLA